MDLKYYWLREVELDGVPPIVSRTGWSSELGYEIYLRDSAFGDTLWEHIMAAEYAAWAQAWAYVFNSSY